MIDALLARIAPHSCCSCGIVGALLCTECKNDIVSEPLIACLGCGRVTAHGGMCSTCRRQWKVADGWMVGVREGTLKSLLDAYKFNSARSAGQIAALLLQERLPLLPERTAVVPVPTAPSHTRARGFDHMALITNQFARRRGMAVANILRRHGHTTQHFKGRLERFATASVGLEIQHPAPETVLLIDDICTTGATLRACVQLLHQAGARTVYIGVVARQPLD